MFKKKTGELQYSIRNARERVLWKSGEQSSCRKRGEPDLYGAYRGTCDMTGKVLSLDPDGC